MVNDRQVVSVVHAWSGALMWTTRCLAGHTTVLGRAAAYLVVKRVLGQQAAA